jgi:hypothetical protein
VSAIGPSLAEEVEKLSRDRKECEKYAGKMEIALEHIRLICRLARHANPDKQDLFELLDVIEEHAKVRDQRGVFL